jgi:hypothetical protein
MLPFDNCSWIINITIQKDKKNRKFNQSIQRKQRHTTHQIFTNCSISVWSRKLVFEDLAIH